MAPVLDQQPSPTLDWNNDSSNQDQLDVRGLWIPKFDIAKGQRIVTAGSCFSRYIGKALVEREYRWINAETAPGSPELQTAFHYNEYSFRTGEICTARMLSQWMSWAFEDEACPDIFWERDGRFFDPFRPTVELDGFSSIEEARLSRQATLAAIRAAFSRWAIFIVTLKTTESWRDKETGLEFADCPGSVAGEFDPEAHVAHKASYQETLEDLNNALEAIRRIRPKFKVILAVSPVQIDMTASEEHAAVAHCKSKSILRAVAESLASGDDNIDYFPAYELINYPKFRGRHFTSDQRSLTREGINLMTTSFFNDIDLAFGRVPSPPPAADAPVIDPQPDDYVISEEDSLRSEEEMLTAFKLEAEDRV